MQRGKRYLGIIGALLLAQGLESSPKALERATQSAQGSIPPSTPLALSIASVSSPAERKVPSTSANSPHIAYNGRIFLAHSSEKAPDTLQIDGRSIAWLPHPSQKGQKIALVPISYHTKPQNLALSPSLTLAVQQAPYKKESITIIDGKKLTPNAATQRRIEQEREEAGRIYGEVSAKRYWRTPFAYPVKNVFITSPFGSARVFNDKVQSYHGGVDFRAAVGVPIYAANDGVVRLAKERVLSGKAIILDHGDGIYTTYFHASELLVKVGQLVRKGQKIALSGATGRVSGAHLHFGVVCNGVQVDPLDFLTQINALFPGDPKPKSPS